MPSVQGRAEVGKWLAFHGQDSYSCMLYPCFSMFFKERTIWRGAAMGFL